MGSRALPRSEPRLRSGHSATRVQYTARKSVKPAGLWPETAWKRWGLRAAYAAPFLILAVVTDRSVHASTANLALVARGNQIRWGDSGLSWIAKVFPPIPAAISSLLGGSTLALSIAAAVLLGFALQRLTGVLIRRGFGTIASFSVMATLVLTPALPYLATNDFQSLLGLVLVLAALDSIALFVERRSTESGFLAGIALALAVMVEPGAWAFVPMLAAIAPFIARESRPRDARGVPLPAQGGGGSMSSNLATMLILLFPAVSAIVFWLYISLWLSADPFGGLAQAPVNGWFPGGVAAAGKDAMVSLLLGFVSAPLFLYGVILRVRREPLSLLAPLVAMVGYAASLWLGLREAAGESYLIPVIFYILLLSGNRPSQRQRIVVMGISAVQIVLVWAIAWSISPAIMMWVRSLL